MRQRADRRSRSRRQRRILQQEIGILKMNLRLAQLSLVLASVSAFAPSTGSVRTSVAMQAEGRKRRAARKVRAS